MTTVSRSPSSRLTFSASLLALLLSSTTFPGSRAVAAEDKSSSASFSHAQPTTSQTTDRRESAGSVTIGGQKIDYRAVAGTLIVHPKGWDDSTSVVETRLGLHTDNKGDGRADDGNPDAAAAMFYVAYFKKDAKPEGRPITFVYNGGPGSASVWLHMGAFGPRRIVTMNDAHDPAAPYQLVNNEASLLDVTDLVFIDAPGTGFGRIAGKDREKSFWGVDADGHAFANFITQFLGEFGRYNSPKFLFGESYGTLRSAVLVNDLQNEDNIDFNGVILLSQILSYDNEGDEPKLNPGNDLPYVLALPTYAATAWYHHRLPGNPPDLKALLKEVEQFASNDYLLALQKGADLTADSKRAVAEKLHTYTGLPVDYLLRADLRVDVGEFEKTLQENDDTTTGRLDSRFSGPTINPLSEEADYDPQSAAISSAYISAFNDYTRKTLGYGNGQDYRGGIDTHWDFRHTPPGEGQAFDGSANVMPDLAYAMKTNPTLKVMLNAGYFDLATPYYEGVYEMKHLQIPNRLQSNIEYARYESGHMVYANETALKQLHENVASFITRSSNVNPAHTE
ncbi:S10 family peptidase [Acetobacter sacchari]|uniref:S10 family peptidase n=1 Tax=Acetobacter sacchari TaxID=2661687 RepID=UPI001FB03BBC|nr:peptidase S10 [Acetobacter sacchari]